LAWSRGEFARARAPPLEPELVARDHASDTSATTPDLLERLAAESRLDGDDLFRFGELPAAVDVETVDHAVVAVDSST
jgi:hypothetical protein